MQLGPELLERLVLVEAPRHVRRALDEDPAGRSDVKGMEVITILQLRGVGEPELFVNRLLPQQRFVGLDVEREVMDRSGAEAPAAAGAVRFVKQIDDARPAASRNFEPVVRTVDADLSETKRLGQERFLFADIADREHRGEESARRDV